MNISATGIIGQSSVLKNMFRLLEKVGPTDSTVLVTGESGTGKELAVRALHQYSARKDKPFVPINCGAIPKDLLESELFGHEKGAFTHALRSRQGRFELADSGTIFLDEIGEMDLSLQVKILRVLQEKEIERVGGNGAKKVDVRVVAATNRNLEQEVERGRFREDLFYRLNVIPIHLPPLRERGGDIALLADYFISIFSRKNGRHKLSFAPEAGRALEYYNWPGNVRELENIMERLAVLCDSDIITMNDLPAKILEQVKDIPLTTPVPSASEAVPPPAPTEASSTPLSSGQNEQSGTEKQQGFTWPVLADLEKYSMNLKDFLDHMEERLLLEALASSAGVKNQAAEILGIKRTTLIEKLKKRNLE
ncbi:MAG: sigma-54 dependent transcriptional regulator [Deltaproteobacteria bacterium]|jgi:transcriptional regulator with GAF, ATPase, and Fis domain|nr:sigma-54 dependent transcriptional regulator [Deltaproteobacteria bacterium]